MIISAISAAPKPTPARRALIPQSVLALLVSLPLLVSAQPTSDDLIYDNVPDPLPSFNDGINAGPPGYSDFQPYRAQPFVTGDLGRVSSVSIYIINGGTARGSIRIVLMDDNSGAPGAIVADLGVIELDPLPVWNTFNRIGALVTLETTVEGLTPNARYHIGIDMHTMVNPAGNFPSASYFNLHNSAGQGTRGADPSLVRPTHTGGDWRLLSSYVTGANYMLMRISQEAPEPPTPPTLLTLTRTTDAITLNWRSAPEIIYSVEHSESLAEGSWLSIAEGLSSDNPELSFQDTNPARLASTQGFYRVRTQANP